MNLTPVEQMAVAKAVAEKAIKEARMSLALGKSTVDFYVHVSGDLSVAADTEKTPTVAIPLYLTLAIALKKSGVQAERILSVIEESVTEAIKAGKSANDDMTVQAEAICDHIRERFAETLPKTPVKGAVKANLSIEKVEAADLVQRLAA